jgi:hypothetical protein
LPNLQTQEGRSKKQEGENLQLRGGKVMLTTGQITPDSPFGQALTKYARQSNTILEIGFGSGLGTTQCLMAGMTRKEQVLHTYEADVKQWHHGFENILKAQGPLTVKCHLGVLHQMVRPYWHPVGSGAHRQEWQECFNTTKNAPVDTFAIGKPWDLVVLDGGEYSSDGDWLLLWPTTRVMALDDLNPALATKNCYAAEHLKKAGWKLEEDGINDRNGWQIWRRP